MRTSADGSCPALATPNYPATPHRGMSFKEVVERLDDRFEDGSGAPGASPFGLHIRSRTVQADRDDGLLAAVIGPEYLEEHDLEVQFLTWLKLAVMIAAAVQE